MDQDKNQTNSTTTSSEEENEVRDINLQKVQEIIAKLYMDLQKEKRLNEQIIEMETDEATSSKEEFDRIYLDQRARFTILIPKIEKLHSEIRELVQTVQKRNISYGIVKTNIELIKIILARNVVDNDENILEEKLIEVNRNCKREFESCLENHVIKNNFPEAEIDFKKQLVKSEESNLHRILNEVATHFLKLKLFHCHYVSHVFCNFGNATHSLREVLKNNKVEYKNIEDDIDTITNLIDVAFELTKLKNEDIKKKLDEFVQFINTVDI